MSDWPFSVTREEVERLYQWAIEKKLERIEAMINCRHEGERVPDKFGSPITGETVVIRCGFCKTILERLHADLEAPIKREQK